jgi:hypothetical protein
MATKIGLQKLTILVRDTTKCIPCIILWLNASGQQMSGVLQSDGTVTILKNSSMAGENTDVITDVRRRQFRQCAIPAAVTCK